MEKMACIMQAQSPNDNSGGKNRKKKRNLPFFLFIFLRPTGHVISIIRKKKALLIVPRENCWCR